ncbi:MAG: nitroreductase/NAD-dependent dihydropyrimidine dehydrogenase PreA subunit [Desulforhopalus sp.]|jgi:nitroreductase/NAD-dependent dihydropyrimidine dehydrogenase PreA subunit
MYDLHCLNKYSLSGRLRGRKYYTTLNSSGSEKHSNNSIFWSLLARYELNNKNSEMIPVIIDTARCSGCGLCVDVCPYKALIVREGTASYILEDCFSCGHCQSVCPEYAIVLPGLSQPTEQFCFRDSNTKADEEILGAGPLVSLMANRRSCRNYKKKEVPLKTLEDLVQIAITAPSGTNCQPWGFIILPCRDDLFCFGILVGNYFKKLNRLAESWWLRSATGLFAGGGLARYYHNHYESVKEALRDWDEKGEDRLFHGAQAAIIVTAKKDASCPGEDAMLASQNILLAAHSMGLGTCLIGFAVEAMRRDKVIRKKLTIPEDEEIYAVIAIGYPRISYIRPAGRKKVIARVFRFDKKMEN